MFPKSLNAVFQEFWRGDQENKKNVHMIKWKEICKPIDNRGPGLCRSKSNNRVLLAKTCWESLSKPNLLCSKILKAKYCPNESLWEALSRKGDSWFWKSFVETLNFINQNIGSMIENGEKISIW